MILKYEHYVVRETDGKTLNPKDNSNIDMLHFAYIKPHMNMMFAS